MVTKAGFDAGVDLGARVSPGELEASFKELGFGEPKVAILDALPGF